MRVASHDWPGRPLVRQTGRRQVATTPAPLTLIDPFEVPVCSDGLFVAAWTRACEALSAAGVLLEAMLFRSVTADAKFRFVEVARISSADAWQRALASGAYSEPLTSFGGHPGLYEVVRVEGVHKRESDAVVITPFEVAAGEDAAFLSTWEAGHEAIARVAGHRGSRLYRSAGLHADFRFVAIARWDTAQAYWHAARQPEFSEAPTSGSYRGHPALYGLQRR